MLVRRALRRSLDQIRHVEPVRPRQAGGLVARVYGQVERDFGMLAPPVALHSPAPEVLAASWLMLRETLVATGLVDRASKEVVATKVSEGNACPYCVEVHSATAGGLGVPIGDAEPIGAWAAASGTRSSTGHADVPFPVEHAPELVGVAVTFQYLNRMVHIFLGDSPLPPTVPAAARGQARRFLGWFMGSAAGKPARPGDSLELLPDAPPAEDLSWTAGNPTIAATFARAAAAIDAAGERSVPRPVRELVAATLSTWDGQPPGPSRAWVADAIAGLAPADHPAARLALLTARAPYQVDQSVIDEFRRARSGDNTLIELTAWASLAAARRVGSWIRTNPTARSRAN
jgi:AhpD family alkylhydroperoxidase